MQHQRTLFLPLPLFNFPNVTVNSFLISIPIYGGESLWVYINFLLMPFRGSPWADNNDTIRLHFLPSFPSQPEYQIADPILTFVFGFIVVVTTLPILRELAHILMQGAPRNVNYLSLLSDLEGLPGVRTVHNLHIWSLTLDKNALSVHLGIGEWRNILPWF